VEDERRCQDGAEESDGDGEAGVGRVRLRIGKGETDREDGERQRMQPEEQVLRFAPVDDVRDAERETDPDVRDDPGEDDASQKLRVHRPSRSKLARLESPSEAARPSPCVAEPELARGANHRLGPQRTVSERFPPHSGPEA
jgi:hypothetical protein